VGLQRWDEFLVERYAPTGQSIAARAVASEAGAAPTPVASARRDYRADARPGIRKFYQLNHANQTLEFVLSRHRRFVDRSRCRMGLWQAMDKLNSLTEPRLPHAELTESDHAFSTAEAIRRDGHPLWLVLAGLIHDLGKLLSLWGEPQWAVVGDTFPVGCGYSDKVVYPEFFVENPDFEIPSYQTACGIYAERCGLDKVHMSWGHDEYLYTVMKHYLPIEALYVIRYHSFYAAHREGAYQHLMSEQDRRMLEWVRKFNNYDLYVGDQPPVDVKPSRPYYEELVGRFLPSEFAW
jgi:inositol oxygenase